jgi:hypothetical protein
LISGFKDYALTSALRDRRFPPIQAKELPSLQCTVSVLTDYDGNILADELVVVVLVSLVPLVVPIPVMFLGLFTSGIQAHFCHFSCGLYR